jgi:glutamate-1-semialdehyde 2,1-aminomutase
MECAGNLLSRNVSDVVAQHGLADYLQVTGRASCLVFVTRGPDGEPSQPYRTLLLQELLCRGVLGQSFVTSAAHGVADVELTVSAMRDALPVYRRAIDAGSVDGLLVGRPVAPALRRTAEPRSVRGARCGVNGDQA